MGLRTILLSLLLTASTTWAQLSLTTLISTGATWKYLADGSDPGTAWQLSSFNDISWPSGPAQFGWGEGDERTPLFFGPSYDESPITTYFRKTYQVTNTVYTLTLRLLRDDGAIVYINGQEVVRNNMPGGAVDFQTFATTEIQTNENGYIQYGVFWNVLASGLNTIAVEIHQAASGRSDCSFDLELIGNIPQAAPRVAITTPANGQTLSAGVVSVSADASDDDGHITQVEFFMGLTRVGLDTEAPFSIDVSAGEGRHRLYAIAHDNYGYYTKSPPLSFQVGGEWPVYLERGPYLQSGSATGLVVRWRTDWPTNSEVWYGSNLNNLEFSTTVQQRTNEHQARLDGLVPDTAYYYQIRSAAQMLAGGGEFVFRTAPTNARPVKVWVIGDSGTADVNQAEVRDAYVADGGPANTALWLMLGDNAYESGMDEQYQTAVFDMYRDILSRLVLWPTIGNHDAASIGSPGEIPYLDIFTLPTGGECGGLPSGTEKYYSFDYANIHFVCLDSQTSNRSTNGPMLNWLREDLAATEKDWVVAYWHHPPYTFGTHWSDSEGQLIEMRERALPILEEHGVDLVLCGHSHVYERSFLLNGHYGYSASLTPDMVLDSGLGRVAPYRKPTGGLGANRGTVYAVCGCSGQGGDFGGFTLHPAMATNLSGFGSMILNFNGLRLDAQFLRQNGSVFDYFTIDKSQPTTERPRLNVVRSGGGAKLSWPTSNPTYALETATVAATNAPWQSSANNVTRVGRRNVVNLGFDNTNRFFRLRSP